MQHIEPMKLSSQHVLSVLCCNCLHYKLFVLVNCTGCEICEIIKSSLHRAIETINVFTNASSIC